MNVKSELLMLYETAKMSGKTELSFRILACLAKMKAPKISIDGLSNAELKRLITECNAFDADKEDNLIGTDETENELNC
ncbi:MAG: hypothetical protein V4482_02775 [Pseudomonadota bacterium]